MKKIGSQPIQIEVSKQAKLAGWRVWVRHRPAPLMSACFWVLPPDPEDAGVPNMDDIPDVSDGEADALAAQATGLHIGATSSSSTSTSGTAHHPSASSSNAPPPPSVDSLPDMDDIPDMEDDTVQQQVEDPAAAAEAAQPLAALGGTGPGVVQTPTAAAAGGGGANVVQLRTYDCLITYDKYYQTPRMWLLGYDEHKAPLAPHLVFQDISSDYAQKTVTVESFPHLSGVACATVHPCKHASVMKKVIDRTNASLAAAKRQVSGGADAEASSTTTTTKKRGWISSAKKAASLGGSSTKKEEWTAEDQQEGLRVDQCAFEWLSLSHFWEAPEC